MAIHHFPARAGLLAEALVRASIRPGGWRQVLARLDAMFPTGTASLSTQASGRQGLRLAGAASSEGFAAGAILRLADLADPSAVVPGTPAPRGASLVLRVDGARTSLLTVSLDAREADACEAALVALLGRMAPLLADSFEAACALAGTIDLDAAKGALRRCWDRAPFGVALVGESLRPLVANVAAEDLLGVRALFAPTGGSGRVRPASTAHDERLQRAALRAAERPGSRIAVDFGGAERGEGLTLRIEAPRCGTAEAGLGGPLVLTFHAPERAAPPRSHRPAETVPLVPAVRRAPRRPLRALGVPMAAAPTEPALEAVL